MSKPKYKVSKILDYGTDNDICKRMYYQFSEILDRATQLNNHEKDKIKEILFDCMKYLIECEKYLNNIEKIHKDFIYKLEKKQDLKITNNSIQFFNPIEEVKNNFESFLIKLIIALRKTFKVAEIIFRVKIDGPKKFEKYLIENKENAPIVFEYFINNKEWGRTLFGLRADVEHKKLYFTNFDLIINDENINYKIPIIIRIEKSILEFAETALNKTFTYCEEIIMLMIDTKMDNLFSIYLIPDNERDKYNGCRFIVKLKSQIAKQIKS